MRKRLSLLLAAVAAAVLATACAQTDAGITTKVKTKLAADSTVKASQIDVDTKNKVVTLTGTVESQAAKDQAVTIARGTTGVADVVDNLTVAGASMPKGTTGTGDMGMPATTTTTIEGATGATGTMGSTGATGTAGYSTGTGTTGTGAVQRTPAPR